MKNLTKVALLASAVLFTGFASAGSLTAGDKSGETKLCMVAGEGSRIQFFVAARDNSQSVKSAATNTECNGESIISFAKSQGNMGVYASIAKYGESNITIYRTVAAAK